MFATEVLSKAAFTTSAARQRIRSLLFVPGNSRKMLEKSLLCPADVLVPDMEDSVPDGPEKVAAREQIASILPEMHSKLGGRALLLPRVNAPSTEWFQEDINAVVGEFIHGISVGKIDTADDIVAVDKALSEAESRVSLGRKLTVIPWIESPKAVWNIQEIINSSNGRIAAVAFGAEDYTHAMGIRRTKDGTELNFARNMVALAARANDIVPLDSPWIAFKDMTGLEQECQDVHQMGFLGKFAIHPASVPVINEVFRPSEEDISWAERVIAVYEEAERNGRGSTSLDGEMVDVPVVKRARKILEAAKL